MNTQILRTLTLPFLTLFVLVAFARTVYGASLASTCDDFPDEQCSVQQGVFILNVNVYDPRYEFDMVMAHEATTADVRNVRELVREMVSRTPNRERQPVLAINADYFGDWGPEGLAVKQGVRILNAARNVAAESVRSSLSIGQDHTIRLGRQSDCVSTEPDGCTAWVPDPQRYYTTVGGGPLFVADGQPRQRFAGDIAPCQTEGNNTSYCTGSFAWSAVGVTADGKTLIIAAAPSTAPKTMWQMSDILLRAGAWRAMKLDGGGSTQLWYRGADLVTSTRPVANALVVFARPENCPLFCDVWLDNVFFADIKFLRDAGLTQGFSDGTFRPDNAITRAEVATLIWRWLRRPPAEPDCAPAFPDFPPADSAHYESLRYLTCAGVMHGFSDGTLRPDADITRGETVSLILRVLLTLRPDEDPLIDNAWAAIRQELGRFPDAPGEGVHDDNIARSRWIGLVHGYSDGFFRPELPVSRGQFAKILTRALYYDVYQTEIFVPCAIDYDTLAAAYAEPGVHSAVQGASPCRTPAALQSGPDQLIVVPQMITFTVAADGSVAPAIQGLDVTIGGLPQAGWQTTTDQSWVTVEQGGGAAGRSALVQLLHPSDLAPGRHLAHAVVAVNDTGAAVDASDTPMTIPIIVDVAERNAAPLAGDVSCDGVRDSVDALFVLQYDVGLRRASTTCPRGEDELSLALCDVSGDGNCDVVDALLLLQCDAGISNLACPSLASR